MERLNSVRSEKINGNSSVRIQSLLDHLHTSTYILYLVSFFPLSLTRQSTTYKNHLHISRRRIGASAEKFKLKNIPKYSFGSSQRSNLASSEGVPGTLSTKHLS